MNRTRKLALIILPIIAVVASLYVAYASNLFFIDILNKAILFEKGTTLLVTFPALFLAATFVLAFFYVYRLAKRPKTFKRHTRLYLIINTVLNSFGFSTSILAGAIVYGNLFSIYPFPGYCFIFMMFHLLLLAADIFGIIFIQLKVKDDEEKFKVKVGYGFATFGWFMFACLVFNRLGTFLMLPMFVSYPTLGMTFPFYLFLLFPVGFGIYRVLVGLDVLTNKKVKIIVISSIFAVVLLLGIYTIIMGIMEPVFVSAISVSMPLERLAAMPVEIPIHMISYIAVGVILLVQAIRSKKEETK